MQQISAIVVEILPFQLWVDFAAAVASLMHPELGG